MAMSVAQRAAISRGQVDRWRRQAAHQDTPVERKQCTICKDWKAAKEFGKKKRKTKSAGVRVYLASECKQCAKERRAAWREEKRKSGELAALQEKWNANRDPEHRREYQREYSRARRERAGVPARGPWKCYRKDSPQLRLIAAPFLEWMDEWLAVTGENIENLCERAGVPSRRVREWRMGPSARAQLGSLDKLAVAMGMPDQIAVLYPLED
jgi:hypothetical protein